VFLGEQGMKRKLCVIVLGFILFSLFITAAKPQPYQSPDTKIRGIVTQIQYGYLGKHLGGTYEITALVSLYLNETLTKPETFTRERSQQVDVSFNYKNPPDCKVGDVVEVFGLWIPVLDVPGSLTIWVDDYVVGSYIDVVPSPSSPELPPEDIEPDAVSIDTQSEYSNGSIPVYYQNGQPLTSLWYDWIYTEGTQVLFLAYYSEAVNSPIITFIGQRYATPDGTDVFMGNTLSLMEAYKDTNGNNVPDVTETSYFFMVNSSVSFTATPIQKIVVELRETTSDGIDVVKEIAHYRWGVRHQTVDAFLLGKNDTGEAKVIVDHVAFSYDYYIQGNVSYLKTEFDIGKIISVEAYEPNISLEGLSLSLLYATTTITSESYSIIVNEQPYDSTIAQPSPVATSRTEVRIENQKTFEFLFGENYTLYRDASTESHRSFSFAVAANTIASNPRVSLDWLLDQLEGLLQDVFPKISAMRANIDLDYGTSTFVYRVCYPVWNGERVKHDPTYVAYINPQGWANIPINPPLELLLAAITVGSIALIVAVHELRRTRRQIHPVSPLIR
jgi:hypothetical protein